MSSDNTPIDKPIQANVDIHQQEYLGSSRSSKNLGFFGNFLDGIDSSTAKSQFDTALQIATNSVDDKNLAINLKLLDAFSLGYAKNNLEGTLIEVNLHLCRLLGYEESELIGRKISDIAEHDNEEHLEYAQAPSKTYPRQKVIKFLRKDGITVYLQASSVLNRNSDGIALSCSTIFTNITDHKELEMLLIRELREKEAILSGNIIGVARKRSRIYQSVNSYFLNLLGYENHEIVGKTSKQLFFDEVSYERYAKEAYGALSAGRIYRSELKLKAKNGEPIWVNMSAVAVPSDPKLSIWAFVDISRQKRAELKMLEAQQAAEVANLAKSRFLATMSHEIRTPMNGIIGLSTLALNQPVSKEVGAYLTKIESSSKALLGILNDVLDFSKIEAGMLAIETLPLSLSGILSEVYGLFTATAQDKSINYRLKVDESLPSGFIGDALRIKQVLFNLLANALKFTLSGSVNLEVSLIGINTSNATIRFAVIDTGIGISQQELEVLLQPFSQVDSSITRRFGGTGLGLSISNQLLKLMGSKLIIDSVAGKGSIFSFELTLPIVAYEPVQIQSKQRKRLAGNLTRSMKSQGKALLGSSIMVAEDNKINQQVVCEFLMLSGANVQLANNGIEALQLLDTREFDAILMDVQMPGMGGLEATSKIRSKLQYQALPIIGLSAGVTNEEREACLKAGMNDFLPKPINPKELVQMLSNWIKLPEEVKNARFQAGQIATIAKNQLDDALFDLSKLEGFDVENALAMVGDEALVIQLLKMFYEDTQNTIVDLTHELEAGDFVAAHKRMHSLIGSAGILGAKTLHADTEAFDRSLKQGSFDLVALQVFTLSLEKTRASLNQFINQLEQHLSEGEISEKSNSVAKDLYGMNILLAEDNHFVGEALKEFLEISGGAVDLAGNGIEALELASKTKYDLVLMDLEMPQMGGIEAAKRLRQYSPFQKIPIIGLSAGSVEEETLACKAAGMDDFISKTMKSEDLILLITFWVNRYRQKPTQSIVH